MKSKTDSMLRAGQGHTIAISLSDYCNFLSHFLPPSQHPLLAALL
jgi:hypothetical protein